MDVLIVSRTRMSDNGRCIGGLTLTGARSVRLVPAHGYNWDAEAPFQVGEVWSLTTRARDGLRPPHTEDLAVHGYTRRAGADPADLEAYLRGLAAELERQSRYWTGDPSTLFNGALTAKDTGAGYLGPTGTLQVSTGFWVPDAALTKRVYRNGGRTKIYFSHPSRSGIRSVSYVGEADAPAAIPAGTLCRMSLARWWPHEGEERCYLQLSGVYSTASAATSASAASQSRRGTPHGVLFEVGAPYLEQEWYKLDEWYTGRSGPPRSSSGIPSLTF